MLEVQIENIIPVTEARDKFNQLVDQVESGDDMFVMTKNGKPAAILVGVHHMEKLTGVSHEELTKETTESPSEPPVDNSTTAIAGAVSATEESPFTNNSGGDISNIPNQSLETETAVPNPIPTIPVSEVADATQLNQTEEVSAPQESSVPNASTNQFAYDNLTTAEANAPITPSESTEQGTDVIDSNSEASINPFDLPEVEPETESANVEVSPLNNEENSNEDENDIAETTQNPSTNQIPIQPVQAAQPQVIPPSNPTQQ